MDIFRVRRVHCLCVVLALFANFSLVFGENPAVNGTSNFSTTATGSSSTAAPLVVKVDISKVAEGGGIPVQQDTTHLGREHTLPDDAPVPPVVKTNSTSSTPPASTSIPIALPPYAVPEKNDGKKSVPKKGVEAPTTTTTTTPKPDVKKPIVTEVGDDVPFAPSNFNAKTKNETAKKPPVGEIPSIEVITEKKKNRQADYIVPIVAVILSVPLVAIIFSVLYKRGSEWWQHRHYRRMDFLIEGMYNN